MPFTTSILLSIIICIIVAFCLLVLHFISLSLFRAKSPLSFLPFPSIATFFVPSILYKFLPFLFIMCKEQLSINDLVEVANRNDRLKLLNDPSVLPGNFDNEIHSVFQSATLSNNHLKQALQLASLFLQEDRLLEFFIPLTYGCVQTDLGSGRTYLTNPTAWKSDAQISLYLRGVKKALDCLAHCVYFRFRNPEDRLWGRTLLLNKKPSHTPSCSKAFQHDVSVIIELNGRLRNYYEDEQTGYSTRSKCDQFRHDFQFAATLVHELVHAFGILRRGNMNEPWIRLDLPDHEWGYAWENFAFGAIINPQDRKRSDTHVQLRKTWSNQVYERNGKEYSAVPVAWTAQWFRKESWARISAAGLLTIPLPVTRIKFMKFPKLCRWIVMTDVVETKNDIEALHNCAVKNRLQSPHFSVRDMELCKVDWKYTESAELQKSNVPVTQRIYDRANSHTLYSPIAMTAFGAAPEAMLRKTSTPCLSCITVIPVAREPLAVLTPQSANGCLKRSREAEDDEGITPSRKLIKV
ncbi:unnamed protein product [Periconia digitata]|uniref:Uncharacterized protein n=1 Tax=Periconia digitata TaxID=1303443 RepID=A0A9W4U7V1_9PLEO|nr:unnamed protein product [Periconia digitata]